MSEPIDLQALVREINEALILAALRGEPKHGYQIAVDVERETDGMFTFQHGTLYPILHRLEKGRRISGKWEKADGRRRKVYSLTDRGREWLTTQSRRVRATFGTLDALLGGEE